MPSVCAGLKRRVVGGSSGKEEGFLPPLWPMSLLPPISTPGWTPSVAKPSEGATLELHLHALPRGRGKSARPFDCVLLEVVSK
jgi:hypothetical protein